MSILKLENYSITYDGRRSAVDRVSMEVTPGEIVVIVGESGSGKSTLLHGILGLLPTGAATKGECRLFGQDVSAMTEARRRVISGQRASMIFQDTGRYMNPIAKIGAQYDEFLRCHGIQDREKRRSIQHDMLMKLHLTEPERVLDSYPFELSGGMRQRVGIAMAMSLMPELLLADEPTSALDVTVQAQVIRQMMELREQYGTTIIMVTHNIGVAAYLADYIGVMQQGRMVEYGPAKQVIERPRDDYTRRLLDAVVEIDDERLIEKNE